MKADRERSSALASMLELDVTLPDPPPDGVAVDPPALRLSKADTARMVLRDKRKMASGGGVAHELPSMPGVNALSFTIRYLPGGRKRFLEYVKLAALNGDVAAKAWWMVYADLAPSYRPKANFDDICAAAGIKPSTFLAGVVGHCMEAMTDMGNLLAAAFHPEVIAAMGKSALNTETEIGAGDRLAFLQGRGFLPTPKGASIHLHANASANAQAAAAASADPSVPKFSTDIASLAIPKTTVQRQIAEHEPNVIDAEAFHDHPEP